MIRSYAAGRRMICRCGLSSTIQLHSDNSHAMVYRQLSSHGMQTTCRQRVRQLYLDSHITHTGASWNRFRTHGQPCSSCLLTMVVCRCSQQHSVLSSIMASVHGFDAACQCQLGCYMQRLLPLSYARLPAIRRYGVLAATATATASKLI